MNKWIIIAGTVLASAITGSATTIEFSTEDGYSAGNLSKNANWGSGSAEDSALFQVNPADGGSVKITGTAGFKRSFYKTGLAPTNVTYQVGMELQFDRDAASSPVSDNNGAIISAEFNDVASVAPTNGHRLGMMLMRRTAPGSSYRLKFFSNIGTPAGSNLNATVSETLLGFGVDDAQSDAIGVNFVVTKGANANSWSAVGTLSNLTTGTLLQTLTIPSFSTSAGYFTNSLYAVINTASKDSLSFVSNRVVNRFWLNLPSAVELSSYEQWASSFLLMGADAASDANPDGDALTNWEEYGLGGNPTNSADVGQVPTYGTVADQGTNWLQLVHVARTDPQSGLEYVVEKSTDLVTGSWTNDGIVVTSGPLDATFNLSTNRMSTAQDPQGFMRLRITE